MIKIANLVPAPKGTRLFLYACGSLSLALAFLRPALAEPGPLNVPILMRAAIGEDACPERCSVAEIGSGPEGFLSAQSGPGEAFREIGRLHDGDILVVCEKIGPWFGVVYGSATFGCRTTVFLSTQQAYTGPCEHGWVLGRYVSLSKEQ